MARCGGFNGGVASICGDSYALGLWFHLRVRLFCAMQARIWVMLDLGLLCFLVVSLVIWSWFLIQLCCFVLCKLGYGLC